MSDTKIIINSVTGGKQVDWDSLMGCYFQNVEDSPDAFSLHVPSGCPIPTKPQFLSNGEDFKFIRGGFLWSITGFQIDLNNVSGTWNNTDRDPAQDEGTFTGQAGGGVGESAASANV